MATKKLLPVEPAEFDEGIVGAVQAMQRGEATEIQQIKLLEWILNEACGLRDWAYRPVDRDTNIALGRQYVGHAIVRALKTDLQAMKARRAK